MANTGIGISGVQSRGHDLQQQQHWQLRDGDDVHDNATRDIFDTTTAGTNGNTGPAIGDFRPENGETLDEFLAAQLKNGEVNGTWKLETNDTNTPQRPVLLRNYLINWSLSFGHGLNADTPVAVPDPIVGDLYVAAPIAGGVSPANAVAGGALGPVIADRNRPRPGHGAGQHTGRV